MSLHKLPSNSEKLLLELVHSENPTQTLCTHFEQANTHEDEELRGVVRELREKGYINVGWASNMPYIVILNNSARTYQEQLMDYTCKNNSQVSQTKRVNPMVFISHRSIDKEIADMLVDFFASTGIPRNDIFCSSLPGNDINEKISNEVRNALKNSVVNIAILSRDYYQSVYCLNEAGILWYEEDVPVIPIALPEINSNNMFGFLNNEYKLRRLDSDTDISYIYDIVCERVAASQIKHSIITNENNKLRSRYSDYLSRRSESDCDVPEKKPISFSEITTDDERIILYYILKKNVRKVTKQAVLDWLNKSEIYSVNIDNGFDLLSSFAGSSITNDTLEFGLDTFRYYSSKATSMLPILHECVEQHTKLAKDTFKTLWDSDKIDSMVGLFIAYIVDERISTFGDRWMAEAQIKSIQLWEGKNYLETALSKNYGSCLQFFIQNDLVYANSWTSHGNPREYTLCPSLQEFLFNLDSSYINELTNVKKAYDYDLPF